MQTMDSTVCRCRSAPPAIGSFHLFFSLPEEMSLHVLSFLSATDMCNIAMTSRELRRFSKENILWKKLCKRQGWVVPRCAQSDCDFFDFKKYYAEKLSLSKPGCMKWCEAKPQGTAPSKRFKHTATTVGNQIAFIGGQETDTKRFNDVIMFDAPTETFTAATIKGDKVPNFSRQTSCLVNDKIFVFGGFDGYGTNFDLAIMDPRGRTWRTVPNSMVRGNPPPSRTNHAAAGVGSKMFVFGGNNNNEAGAYQVKNSPTVGLTANMGGSDKTAVVSILRKGTGPRAAL